jgi:hypothetical protein
MARDSEHRFQSTREVVEALDRWQATRQAVTVPPDADPIALVARETQGAIATAQGVDRAAAKEQQDNTALPAAEPQGSSTLKQGQSEGSWASSQLSVPKSNAPVWAAVGIAVVVLAGGLVGGWVWMKSSRAQVPADEKATIEAAAHDTTSPSPAAAERPSAEVSVTPEPLATTQPDAAAPTGTSEPAKTPRATPASAPSGVAPRRPMASAQPQRAQPTAPSSRRTPPPKPKASQRPATPDFGY